MFLAIVLSSAAASVCCPVGGGGTGTAGIGSVISVVSFGTLAIVGALGCVAFARSVIAVCI